MSVAGELWIWFAASRHTHRHKVYFLPCYHGQARAVRSAVLVRPNSPEWPWRWPPSSWVIPLTGRLCLTQQWEQHATIQMLWQGALLECCSRVCKPRGWRDGWMDGRTERKTGAYRGEESSHTQHSLVMIWSKQITTKDKEKYIYNKHSSRNRAEITSGEHKQTWQPKPTVGGRGRATLPVTLRV